MRFFATFVCAALLWPVACLADGAPPPRLPPEEGKTVSQPPDKQEPANVKPTGIQEEFVLPSGNIGCIYTPEGGTDVYQPEDGGPELACDRVQPRYVRATLSRKGAAVLLQSVGDPSCCSASRVLDYGERWAAGPFSCVSRRTGLTCERDDAHSFFLSRRRISAD